MNDSDPYRYRIRALDRSLGILQVLNQYNGLNASELSRIVELPRPTVLRFLSTLMECGYVRRSDSDERYRVSQEVRNLTGGYREEPWLTNIVRPCLMKMQKGMIWPLAFLRLHKYRLIVDVLTDSISPMVERRDSVGAEVPLLSSASGYLLMAMSEPDAREALIEHALRTEGNVMECYGHTEETVRSMIKETAQNGYVVIDIKKHTALSVPVYVDGCCFGAITMRVKSLKTWETKRISGFIATLMVTAEEIGARIEACMSTDRVQTMAVLHKGFMAEATA